MVQVPGNEGIHKILYGLRAGASIAGQAKDEMDRPPQFNLLNEPSPQTPQVSVKF